MKSKKSEYDRIVDVFLELKKQYPNYTIGQHLSTALCDYPDLWCTTEREILFALNKYQTELELDCSHIIDESYVNKVVSDGLNLEHLFDEEDEEED